jgi:polysaccharide export outer membrane protein
MTVLDVVLAAGGITEFASPDRTELYRHAGEGASQSYPVHLARILERGEMATNYPLQPGDVITVPQRAF